MVGEDVVTPVELVAPLRSDAHDGKIGRAAPDVSRQHDLFGVHAPFVVERGGNRLVLKEHLVESDLPRRRVERRLRRCVARRVVVDEVHRPAQHDAADRLRGVRLGTLWR